MNGNLYKFIKRKKLLEIKKYKSEMKFHSDNYILLSIFNDSKTSCIKPFLH